MPVYECTVTFHNGTSFVGHFRANCPEQARHDAAIQWPDFAVNVKAKEALSLNGIVCIDMTYDPACDALYMRLAQAPVETVEDHTDDGAMLILDVDAEDNVVGIEIVGAKANGFEIPAEDYWL